MLPRERALVKAELRQKIAEDVDDNIAPCSIKSIQRGKGSLQRIVVCILRPLGENEQKITDKLGLWRVEKGAKQSPALFFLLDIALSSRRHAGEHQRRGKIHFIYQTEVQRRH